MVVAVLASACGGPSASPEFAGRWEGTVAQSFVGLAAIQYATALHVEVQGEDVTASGVCADGSGSLRAEGTGPRAEWKGAYACPPIAFSDCQAVTLTYTTASLEVSPDGSLRAQGAGFATGCGASRAFTSVFTGRKR